MVKAVRAQGTPVWFLTAEDEGHSFGKADNRSYLTQATLELMGLQESGFDLNLPFLSHDICTVLDLDAEGDLVAARRVHVVHLGLVGLAQPLVLRVLVMVQDDLLVHRVELHEATPKNSCARRTPATRASTTVLPSR